MIADQLGLGVIDLPMLRHIALDIALDAANSGLAAQIDSLI
ncbi:MAG TPA: hypothetical protein VGI31_10070 [Streptosporangiaceae bacterium]